MDFRVYTSTEKSWSVDHICNEDRYMFSEYSFMEDEKIRLLVVADGMGGLADGEKASANAVKGFLRTFYTEIMTIYMNTEMDEFSLKYSIKDVENVLIRAVQCANETVCDNSDLFRATGSTISVVCIVGDFAVIANVGDSPVYFYRRHSRRLKLVSTLQTQAEQDVEAGLYERYSSDYYANEHRIYSNLGQYSNLRDEDICISSIGHLQEGDIFLVGSDGAFGRMQEQEILELIDGCAEEEEGFVLEQLFNSARMDKNDDQTAIMYVVANEVN